MTIDGLALNSGYLDYHFDLNGLTESSLDLCSKFKFIISMHL